MIIIFCFCSDINNNFQAEHHVVIADSMKVAFMGVGNCML